MNDLRRSADSNRFHQNKIPHENSHRTGSSPTYETANLSIKNIIITNAECRKPMLHNLIDHPNMSSMSGGSTSSTTAIGLNSNYANENGNVASSLAEIQFDEREIYYVSPSRRKNGLSASQTPVLRSSLRACERFRSFSPTSAATVAPSYPPVMPSVAYGARLSGTPGQDLSFDNYDTSSHYSDTAMQVLRSGSCSGIFNTNNLINSATTAINNCHSSSSSLAQQQHSQQQPSQQQSAQQTQLAAGQRTQNNVVTFSNHISEQRANTPQNRGSLRRGKGRSSQSLCSCDAGDDTELNPDPSRPLYEYSLERRHKGHTYTCEQNAQILLRLERERNRRFSLSGGSLGGGSGSRDDLENDFASSSDAETLPPVPPPPAMKRNGSIRSLRLLQHLHQQQSTLRSGAMCNGNQLNNSSNKSLHHNSINNNNSNNTNNNNNVSNNSNNNGSIATLCSGDLLNDCAKTGHDVRAVIDDCTTSILKCANAMGSDIMSNTSTTTNGSYKTQLSSLNAMVSHSKPDVCHVPSSSTKKSASAYTSYFGNFPPPYAVHDDIILPKSQKSDPLLCFLHKKSLLNGMGMDLGHVLPPTSSSTSVAFANLTQSQRDLQQKLQYYKNSSRLSLSKYNTIGPSSDYARQLAVYAQQQQLLHHLQQTHLKPFSERCRCFSKSWSNFSRDLNQTQCTNDAAAAYRINNHDNHSSLLYQQQPNSHASVTLAATAKGRLDKIPLRSSLNSRSFNNLIDIDTYNPDMASILSSNHKLHFNQQNPHKLACNGVSLSMGGGGSTIHSQMNNDNSSGLKDNHMHGQASLKIQQHQHQQHKLLQHHYQHEQLKDFHCNEHDNHHPLSMHGSTHLIKSSEKFHQHKHHHHHHSSISSHHPSHHSSLTSIMPWKHRQSPSRGSSSSGTNSFRFDAAKHWLAVSSILLIIGAASVAVPLALRVAASAPFEERLRVALQLLDQVPLIDGHNDLPWNIRKFLHNKLNDFNFNEDLREVMPWKKSHWSHTDLTRLKKGRISAQFWAAYVPCEAQHRDAVQLTLEQIDVIKRLTDRYSPQLTTCTSAQDIIEAHKNHQLCSLTGVEGGHSLGGSLAVLRTLYAIGVRYMTLTSTCHTPWADSSYADAPTYNVKHGGLTIFGKVSTCHIKKSLLHFNNEKPKMNGI